MSSFRRAARRTIRREFRPECRWGIRTRGRESVYPIGSRSTHVVGSRRPPGCPRSAGCWRHLPSNNNTKTRTLNSNSKTALFNKRFEILNNQQLWLSKMNESMIIPFSILIRNRNIMGSQFVKHNSSLRWAIGQGQLAKLGMQMSCMQMRAEGHGHFWQHCCGNPLSKKG